jgi:hypothetical protein
MHEYFKIKKPLRTLFIENGLIEDVEDLNVDYYGSMQSIFASKDFRFMIFWNGEDGLGGVERYLGDGRWEVLDPVVTEANDEKLASSIDVLVDSVKRLF